jgi:hypothetical protein
MKILEQKLRLWLLIPRCISSQCLYVNSSTFGVSDSFQAGTSETNMLVVSDIDDVFLPKPTDLLVNLTESRASIESLLGRLNDMFQDNHVIGSAMGPALQAGFKLMVSPLVLH